MQGLGDGIGAVGVEGGYCPGGGVRLGARRGY